MAPARTTVEVDAPRFMSEVAGWDIDKWADKMAARERDHQSEPGGPSTPAPSSEPAEQARASTPAPPVRDPEPPVSVNAAHRVPDSPAPSSPVSPDIEQAATALAMRVWQDGAKSGMSSCPLAQIRPQLISTSTMPRRCSGFESTVMT